LSDTSNTDYSEKLKKEEKTMGEEEKKTEAERVKSLKALIVDELQDLEHVPDTFGNLKVCLEGHLETIKSYIEKEASVHLRSV